MNPRTARVGVHRSSHQQPAESLDKILFRELLKKCPRTRLSVFIPDRLLLGRSDTPLPSFPYALTFSGGFCRIRMCGCTNGSMLVVELDLLPAGLPRKKDAMSQVSMLPAK